MPLRVKNPHFSSSRRFPAKKNMRKILMTPFAPIFGETVYKRMALHVVK